MKWFYLTLFFLGLVAVSLAENSSEAATSKSKEEHPKAITKDVKKEVKTIENSSEVHEDKKEKPVKKAETKEAPITSTTSAPATATTPAPKEESKGLFSQVVDSVVGAVQSVRDHVKNFFGFGSSEKTSSPATTVAPTAAPEPTKKQ